MRNIVLWAVLILVMGSVNFSIFKKEETLNNGQVMLLELAPVDPRSLIQGDYMRLRYKMGTEVEEAWLEDEGRIVVRLDENNVATFVRVDKGEKLQESEHLLAYKNRRGMRLGAESYFFQEGNAELYANAEYGELRVDSTGASVLAGLRDENFERLDPSKSKRE